MNISSGQVINLLLSDLAIAPLIGHFSATGAPAVFSLGFQPNGAVVGCLVGVAPLPTGTFARQANGTLRGGGELVIRVYQYPATQYNVQRLVPLICDRLASGGVSIQAYEENLGDTQTVPYWELCLEGSWSLTETPGEVECYTSG